MKKFAIALLFLTSCASGEERQAENEKEIRRDFKAVIFSISGNMESPLAEKRVMFQVVDSPNVFFELTPKSEILREEWFFNHSVGDTCSFDYLKRERFFNVGKIPIKRSEVKDTESSMTREERLFGPISNEKQ